MIPFFSLGRTESVLNNKSLFWACIVEGLKNCCSQKRNWAKVHLQVTILCKGEYLYQIIGIWKDKYNYLNFVDFDLAYIC